MAKAKKKKARAKRVVRQKRAKRIVRPRKPKFLQTTVGAAAADAFSNAEGLRDELQEWYDNLPENFQNSDKGDTLQTAISALDSCQEPGTIPDSVSNIQIEYANIKRRSRAQRMAECIELVQSAAANARLRAEAFDSIEYDEVGNPVEALQEGDPESQVDRDAWCTEIEEFAADCDELVSEWENIEFPGMY